MNEGNGGSFYDADYFLRGKQTGKSLYEDYRWLPEFDDTYGLRDVRHLGIGPDDTILDFGCARGYTVRAFREMGYAAWGHDISKWALENADETTKEYLIGSESALAANGYDWVIAKDVLEHVGEVSQSTDDTELCAIIGRLKTVCRKGVFAVVPLACASKYRYDVPEYDMDATHVHRHPLRWWTGKFHQAGWLVEGRYRVVGIKDNYAQYPTGNGFIVAKRLD